jgi:hypothetical protein
MEANDFNPIFLLEIPNSKMTIPVTNELVINPNSTNILFTNSVDICQYGVKNQNDFSRQILTSGGMMYEKSRVLF